MSDESESNNPNAGNQYDRPNQEVVREPDVAPEPEPVEPDAPVEPEPEPEPESDE